MKMEKTETFGEWINRIAEIKTFVPSEGMAGMKYWSSKIDNSYIDSVENDHTAKTLFKFGITEFIQASYKDGKTATIGFNPDEQKWYGWSHRAIFGFGIGTKVTKESVAYRPSDKDSFLEAKALFWKSEEKENMSAKHSIDDDGTEGIVISWEYSKSDNNGHLQGSVMSLFTPYPKEWGKGEWTARDLKDAKQMAIDFAQSVG